jgi:hypothetical protein
MVHPVNKEAKSCHLMFLWMIGVIVYDGVRCCGFSVYVN